MARSGEIGRGRKGGERLGRDWRGPDRLGTAGMARRGQARFG